MVAAHRALPDLNGLDVEGLKALVLVQHVQLVSRDVEIQNLQLLILKLKRMQFGRKSEKLDRRIDQLELLLEDLETARQESAEPAAAIPAEPASEAARVKHFETPGMGIY
jgi:hypothetical protein